jgi:hypothetical protein
MAPRLSPSVFGSYLRPIVAPSYTVTEKGMRITALDESGQHRVAAVKDHLTDVVHAVLHELC